MTGHVAGVAYSARARETTTDPMDRARSPCGATCARISLVVARAPLATGWAICGMSKHTACGTRSIRARVGSVASARRPHLHLLQCAPPATSDERRTQRCAHASLTSLRRLPLVSSACAVPKSQVPVLRLQFPFGGRSVSPFCVHLCAGAVSRSALSMGHPSRLVPPSATTSTPTFRAATAPTPRPPRHRRGVAHRRAPAQRRLTTHRRAPASRRNALSERFVTREFRPSSSRRARLRARRH